MIPDAAIEAAAEALAKKGVETWATDAWFARAALEAAMPAIREALAQEIDARAQKVWESMGGGTGYHTYLDAARIVRGV